MSATEEDASGLGYIRKIPVRNLFLLLFYASDLFRVLDKKQRADAEDRPDDLPNLVAKILAHAAERRLRRRLSLGYRMRAADLNRVRGRIDMLRTERRRLLERGLVACRFEELAVDTPRNRYVRAALEKLSSNSEVERDLAARCRAAARAMEAMGVAALRPSWREVAAEGSAWREAEDLVMVAAAKLAFDMALPSEMEGDNTLYALIRKKRWVEKLFEHAVRGFYKVTLWPEWRVDNPRLSWGAEYLTLGAENILPGMETDIVLDSARSNRRIVVDTKFTEIVTRRYDKERAKTGHLYQIYAYLRSQAGRCDDRADGAEGVLLYPKIETSVDERVAIQGHRIGFQTVDLTAKPKAIGRDLLRAVRIADPRDARA